QRCAVRLHQLHPLRIAGVQMVAAEGRICPGCGTRAKAKWEFCPRCGESLANASEALSAEAASSAPDTMGADDYEDAGGSWKGFAGAVALVAVGIVAFVTLRRPSPPPDAGIFAVANETAPTPAPPRPPKKGADTFAKGLSLLTDGNVAEAIPLLAAAAQEDAQNALYRHTYGRALWLANQKDSALGELAAATDLNPDSPVY